jgi:hypothetical protein
MLEIKQEKVERLPACKICWEEAIKRKMTILSVSPIHAKVKEGKK